MLQAMTQDMINTFESTYKMAMIATIGNDGHPHLTLLSSMQAISPTQLVIGQFTEGLSKENFLHQPVIGFLVMSLDKKIWHGTARWTHHMSEGAEFDMYNQKPLFRYNTYFGVHTVHYFDLINITEGESLNMGAIIRHAAVNVIAKQRYKRPQSETVLKPWAEKLMKGLNTLKFIAYIQPNGHPAILPVIEAQAADSQTMVLPARPYAQRADHLEPGMYVAMIGVNFDMVGTLVKGVFQGYQPSLWGDHSAITIEQVYNSLPPKSGYIYP